MRYARHARRNGELAAVLDRVQEVKECQIELGLAGFAEAPHRAQVDVEGMGHSEIVTKFLTHLSISPEPAPAQVAVRVDKNLQRLF
jgi:hypothetical protein